MRFSSLNRIIIIICLIVYPTKASALSGASLINLIESTAQKNGIRVVPLTSKIRIWPSCNGKLVTKPIGNNWKTVKVECVDNMGPAWRAVIRNKILGTDYIGETFTDLNPEKDNAKLIKKDYQTRQKKLGFKHSVKKLKTKQNIHVVKFRIPLKNNTIIQSSDLYMAQASANQSQLYFRRKSDVIGRKTRAYVAANIPVAPRHLHTRWDIYKGDSIPIYTAFGAIQISASGIVLNDAQVGGRVLVKNPHSGRILKGILEKGKKIKIFSKQLR